MTRCLPGPTQPPTEPSQPTNRPTDAPYPTNHPGKYRYDDVLAKSLLFYEAERSGPLPSDNRVPWRGDSALGDAVTGGYYDAGDHVKFGFPMAAMTTILSWGGISFYEGYEKAGQLEWMDKCIKWSTDHPGQSRPPHPARTSLVRLRPPSLLLPSISQDVETQPMPMNRNANDDDDDDASDDDDDDDKIHG